MVVIWLIVPDIKTNFKFYASATCKKRKRRKARECSWQEGNTPKTSLNKETYRPTISKSSKEGHAAKATQSDELSILSIL